MKAQEVYRGAGSLLIANLAQIKQAQNILVVQGNHAPGNSIVLQLQQLHQSVEVIFTPAGILQLHAIPKVNTPDVVIAIGGGRVIDYAKGIIHHNHLIETCFIAVPTTAGSGSEATPFAVFYHSLEKSSLEADFLLPGIVVLDPLLLLDLPGKQKAVSAADCFSQCIESIWNKRSTLQSESFALDGIQIARENMFAYVQGADPDAGRQMLEAAYLSGKAIAITRTTGPHALSYYLTAQHQVPHGQAVALFLPVFFLYNESASPPQLKKIYNALGVASSLEAYEFCSGFFKSCGLIQTLPDLNVGRIDIEKLVGSVNLERFANNPKPYDSQKIIELLAQYLT
jgi:alcohol dehydrogenase class IV